MLQSKLFTRTRSEAPKDEEALNAKLLIRAGYIEKIMAGVYAFLPLGLKVLARIEQIVREEMDRAGGEELLLPALEPKENWEKTGRWKNFDALFKLQSQFGGEYALGPTHEEIITPLAQKFISSYKDLPFAAYQFQTKFRDEKRPKSGLLRGREFRMKDMYSFHVSPEDLAQYYETVRRAYNRVFERVGLSAIFTEASGGSFSPFSHEFQVLSKNGEDVVYHCAQCDFAKNKEVIEGELRDLPVGGTAKCPACGGTLQVSAAVEVGNIFQLGTRFSDAFGLAYKHKTGVELPVYMGCYGLGTTRLMGVLAEVISDEKGLKWPKSVAPFDVHLIQIGEAPAAELYDHLQSRGIRVLYDERDVSPGEKLVEADLLGIPWRFVVSPKTGGKIEVKSRSSGEVRLATLEEAAALI